MSVNTAGLKRRQLVVDFPNVVLLNSNSKHEAIATLEIHHEFKYWQVITFTEMKRPKGDFFQLVSGGEKCSTFFSKVLLESLFSRLAP